MSLVLCKKMKGENEKKKRRKEGRVCGWVGVGWGWG